MIRPKFKFTYQIRRLICVLTDNTQALHNTMQGVFISNRHRPEEGNAMNKKIRLKEVVAEEPNIKEIIEELMDLSEQLIIKSVFAYDMAQTIKMKLEGDA